MLIDKALKLNIVEIKPAGLPFKMTEEQIEREEQEEDKVTLYILVQSNYQLNYLICN